MPETVIGQGELIGLGLKSRIMPFKTIRNVGDIRAAKHDLQMLTRDQLQAHVHAAQGDIEGYVRKHDEGLKEAESAVEHLYDSIQLDIINLQIIKSIIRKMYKEDEGLMKKGIPPKIGVGLRNGIAHTRQAVNSMLRKSSDMLGAMTKS